MLKEYVKKMLAQSLIGRIIQVKTTMRYCLILIRNVHIKKNSEIISIYEDVGTVEHLYPLLRFYNGIASMEYSMVILQILNIASLYVS